MQVYIAILRGINVSGKNKIAMKDLKAALVGEGFQNVETYIQSGNVVFNCKEKDEKKLAQRITESIKKYFELDVPVLVLTVDYIKNAHKANPFLKQKGVAEDKLHFTFLAEEPAEDNINKVKTYSYPPDEYEIIGKTIYVHCPNGYGRTKLTNTFFENKLKTAATTRNMKTVNKLIEMGEAAAQ